MNLDTITAPIHTVEKGLSSSRSDLLAIEEPLQICLNGFPLSITMRTPGSDLDLATGFLFTERIISDVGQILSMRAESAEDDSENSGDRVTIRLRPEVAIDPARIRRNFYTSSSCGVCGKVALGAIEVCPSRPMQQSGPQFHADLIDRSRQKASELPLTSFVNQAVQSGDLANLQSRVKRPWPDAYQFESCAPADQNE
jgi:FdhD protein